MGRTNTASVIFDTLFAGILICQLTHWLPNLKHDGLHIRLIAVSDVAVITCE